jgi:hypothetical protein
MPIASLNHAQAVIACARDVSFSLRGAVKQRMAGGAMLFM